LHYPAHLAQRPVSFGALSGNAFAAYYRIDDGTVAATKNAVRGNRKRNVRLFSQCPANVATVGSDTFAGWRIASSISRPLIALIIVERIN
jgi:hypothetical protein